MKLMAFTAFYACDCKTGKVVANSHANHSANDAAVEAKNLGYNTNFWVSTDIDAGDRSCKAKGFVYPTNKAGTCTKDYSHGKK